MSQYPEGKGPLCPLCGLERIKQRGAKRCQKCARDPHWHERDAEAAGQIAKGYEWAWAEWQRYIRAATDRYAGPAKRPVRIGRQKILVASDLHIPFQERAAVAEMFTAAADCDLAIFAGDLQDSYAISRFLKYEHVPLETELGELTVFLEHASQTWPRVILLEGNHGLARFQKQLLDRLPEEMIKAVQFLAGGNLSLLAACAKRFPNVSVGSTTVDRHRLDWLYQVGDLLVCHAEKFSIVPGSAMRKLEEWLTDMTRTLGLAPWRVVLQAHTHQHLKMPWHGTDRLLLETMCLSGLHGYQIQARIGGRPQQRGWITLEQVDGVTDPNSVRDFNWDLEQAFREHAA
ncbi:MAG: metallophosphoesterase [Gallionellaceae bacterium]|nr:metallophosphoesterase [Gallionellaceae bacterium]